jgi:hypothetical protein
MIDADFGIRLKTVAIRLVKSVRRRFAILNPVQLPKTIDIMVVKATAVAKIFFVRCT